MSNNYLWHKLFYNVLKLSELLREWEVGCVLWQGWLVQPAGREVKMNAENTPCLNKMSVGTHSKHKEFLLSHCGCLSQFHRLVGGFCWSSSADFPSLALVMSCWEKCCVFKDCMSMEEHAFTCLGLKCVHTWQPGLRIHWAWNCVYLCVCVVYKIKPAIQCLLRFGPKVVNQFIKHLVKVQSIVVLQSTKSTHLVCVLWPVVLKILENWS